jgi:hypothetical protein
MATPTITNVIVGEAYAYTAPASTAMPVDTVAEGASWGGSWVYVGATEEGVTVNHSADTNEIRIEEQSLPVRILKTTTNFRITASLSEDTVETMKLAYSGATITTTAAATGQPGKKTLALSDTLTELALGFEATNSFGFWRRVYIPRVLSLADVGTPYRRAANNRVYPVEFRAICKPSDIQIVDKTAAALP